MYSLFFSQQHLYTQMGHTVPLKETPHYRYLEGDVGAYEAYLRDSWLYHHPGYTPASIASQVARYASLVQEIREEGVQVGVTFFERPNGDRMIYDGNHRSSIAAFFNLPLPGRHFAFIEAIKRVVDIPRGRWGIGSRNMPYESIYSPEGEIVLPGRREDLLDRAALIRPEDVRDKDVVDVGCNYGMALMLTRGAMTLTGIDVDVHLLTSAVRLAVIFRKPARFLLHDMSHTPTPSLGLYDTAFIFSLDAHLDNLAGLVEFIRHNVLGVVYYETHSGHKLPLAVGRQFLDIELLGDLGGRKLYRCVK